MEPGRPTAGRRAVGAYRADLAGIGALVGLALAFLSPALKDGLSFGGFDYDTTLTPLGAGIYPVVDGRTLVHATTNGDAVSQMVAWNDLSWQLVHHGHFPMWNVDSVLGMPQFLNFESSVLSLPDLVSYAFPARMAFLVVVFVKLVLAGSGTYAFVRLLGARPLAATLGGAGYMLCGAFASWLTWPLTDVLAWAGWICAFGLLCVQRRSGLLGPSGLAISVAFAVYGGFPEGGILLAAGLAVVVVVALAARRTLPLAGVARLTAGGLLGAMLSAPLWLPGLQVIAHSHREGEGHYVGLPTRTLASLLAQGYFGLPTGPAPHFQLPKWSYYETVSYVGPLALVLAVVGVVAWRRRPVVIGLAAGVCFGLLLSYQPVPFHPLQHLWNALPVLDKIRYERMRTVTSFFIAVLAALGLDALVHQRAERPVRRAFALATVVLGAWVAYLDVDSATDPALRHLRAASLAWPNVLVVLLVATGLVAWRGGREDRQSALVPVLALAQVGFLFFAGVGIPSYSKAFFATTPAIAELRNDVGDGLLGLNGGNTSNVKMFTHVGFYPNVNVGYGIRLFAVHDPLMPAAYYESWPEPGASNKQGVALFVPDVSSASLARRYGIAYVLSAPGVPPPAGSVRVAEVAGEELSRIPGAAQFSFSSGAGNDRVVSVRANDDGAWSIVTEGSGPGTLVARITALPGFRATIDGRPLALRVEDGVMLSARLPPGRHVVTIVYLPERLEIGVALALLAVAALAAALGLNAVRTRRALRPSRQRGAPGAPGGEVGGGGPVPRSASWGPGGGGVG